MKPFRSNVPLVSVVPGLLVPLNVSASLKVVVLSGQLITIADRVLLPFEIIVPVPFVSGRSNVYVPPGDNIKLFTRTIAEVSTSDVIVPKSSVLTQLPDEIVIPPAPEPVNVKFGVTSIPEGGYVPLLPH